MAPDGLPSGTVTLLFTDIEGSTRLLKQLGDRYGDVLSAHRRLLREAFAAHDGREIDTQGDAFFVAFPRAKDAVAAAVQAQRALAAHEWPDGATVRVRMGIHTGEPVLGEEGYHGLGLHRGARICSAGHGGQILLSNATRELIEDDVELVDLGEHRLKDIDRPEHLAQVPYPGMPASFPPLKTAEATPFAGQEEALAEQVATRFGWARTRRPRLLGVVLLLVAAGIVVLLLTHRSGNGTMAKLRADALAILSPDGHELVATVPVGTSPSGVAVGAGAIWVTNADDQTVSRIGPETHHVDQTIEVGSAPQGVAVAGGFVWVADAADGTVAQIDPRIGGGKVLQRIPVGNQPTDVAAAHGAVWVANSADSTVTRIDPATAEVAATVKVPGGADALAGGDQVWVVGERGGTVTSIDPTANEPLQSIPVGQGPTAAAAGAGAVWVANTLDGTVSKVDPERSSVLSTIPVGREPRGIAAGGHSVWVSDESGRLTQIDAARAAVKKVVVVGNRPSAVAASADSVYVALRAAGPAHRGGILRLAADKNAIDSLDPALAYAPATVPLTNLLHAGLVGFRRTGGAAGGQLVPDLATSLPRPAAGGRLWSFHLRPGVRYSNGQPVLAGDIRRAIERNFAIRDSPGPQYFASILGASACMKRLPSRCELSEGIRTSDAARTVTFRLSEPDPDLLYKLTLPNAAAVPRSTPLREVKNGIPATGPYAIARVTEQRVELVRNRHFRVWSSAARPDGYPDRIEIERGLDPPAQVTAVERGTADVALDEAGLPPKEVKRLRTLRAAQSHFNPAKVTDFVFFDTRQAPFDDIRVRRAINLAVDRSFPHAVDVVGACQILPPNFVGYRRYCPFGLKPELARARRLVRASGTRGARVTVWSPPEVAPPAARVARVVVAMRRLGYRVHVRQFNDFAKYFGSVSAPGARVQAGWDGWAADYPSPNGMITAIAACGGIGNFGHYCNRSLDAAIRHAGRVAIRDPQAAGEQWARIDRRLTDLAAFVPLSNTIDFSFVGTRVGHFQYHTQWGVLLDQLWVR